MLWLCVSVSSNVSVSRSWRRSVHLDSLSMRAVTVVAALLLALLSLGLSCSSAGDCNNNGVCDAFGLCVCNLGYLGANCSASTLCLSTIDPVVSTYNLFLFNDYNAVNGSRGTFRVVTKSDIKCCPGPKLMFTACSCRPGCDWRKCQPDALQHRRFIRTGQ
jgi:hypothetical protein